MSLPAGCSPPEQFRRYVAWGASPSLSVGALFCGNAGPEAGGQRDQVGGSWLRRWLRGLGRELQLRRRLIPEAETRARLCQRGALLMGLLQPFPAGFPQPRAESMPLVQFFPSPNAQVPVWGPLAAPDTDAGSLVERSPFWLSEAKPFLPPILGQVLAVLSRKALR